MGRLRIRSAAPEDAAVVLELKRAAIDGIEAGVYTDRQLSAWRPGDGALSDFRRAIASERFEILLAERDDPVGYGVLNGNERRVDAVFVHPERHGEGIGSSLVRQFESRARVEGIAELSLLSSLNAVGFYESLGYWETGRKLRTIGGVEIEFALMRSVIGDGQ
ncbi:MAG: GNAT family N-acetyltransferase [Natrialbaceae archaeon]